ncbi:hypothetical protein GXN76_05220 [Kroppenstedtia pulmonis]|uniref:Uncharacterized protein n=1 Tax=Kroppenstedtia pulmonis TaxID=1380685 RepID=A0A7D4BGW5_9BACL|nr:hypothetical protein [Kroppenstedtia pulmonis]QKG83935.1 hypothetical protein GXN76_05220 [Kroppenstedtia pulmonis]
MIISRTQIALAKVEELKNGYSAYAETQEVARKMEKQLQGMDISVHIDKTPIGYWFIPECGESTPHHILPTNHQS